MVAWNEPFLRLLDFPHEMAFVGADFESFIRYNAERGEYGPGEVEAQVAERVDAARRFRSHITERVYQTGASCSSAVSRSRTRASSRSTDITDQRQIDELLRRQSTELEDRVQRRTAQLERRTPRTRASLPPCAAARSACG